MELMLHIVLAYLMLFSALFTAVSLYNEYLFFAIDFCKCFLFSCLCIFLLFVYLKCYFASYTVPFISWFY